MDSRDRATAASGEYFSRGRRSEPRQMPIKSSASESNVNPAEGYIDKAQRHLTPDVALAPHIADLEHHGDAGCRVVYKEVAAEVEQMAADGRRIFRKGAVINKELDSVDE